MLVAGGDFKPGLIHGEIDDFTCSVLRDEVTVHDLHATLLQ
ncbi:MAG: DUF1501 domain-containing protein [Akkermansiaceae bacterium]